MACQYLIFFPSLQPSRHKASQSTWAVSQLHGLLSHTSICWHMQPDDTCRVGRRGLESKALKAPNLCHGPAKTVNVLFDKHPNITCWLACEYSTLCVQYVGTLILLVTRLHSLTDLVRENGACAAPTWSLPIPVRLVLILFLSFTSNLTASVQRFSN